MMPNTFQDDEREDEMRSLFGMYKDETEGRSGIDAFLDLDNNQIPFELKTTSNGSVTTVRDFGPDHIRKWESKHWLIGFFERGRTYYKYGSPAAMRPWIREKEAYILPDFNLAQIASRNLELDDMYEILGNKNSYTLDDAKKLHKRQLKIDEYKELQDLHNGYSPSRMLDILKDRLRYIAERGSTLNNPHIPKKYFEGWTEITTDHAETLKTMIRAALTNDA